uniref:Fanconi-associated nuclease n=1 Tax=Romanomermis culicivorax TaxID=13658 RepID=A0A915L8C8_ROMCU
MPVKMRLTQSSSQSDMFSTQSSKRFKKNDENTMNIDDDDEIEILAVYPAKVRESQFLVNLQGKEIGGKESAKSQDLQHIEPSNATKPDNKTYLNFSSENSNSIDQKNFLVKENMIELMKTPKKRSKRKQKSIIDTEDYENEQKSPNSVDFVPYSMPKTRDEYENFDGNSAPCELVEQTYQQNRYGCFKLEIFDQILTRIGKRKDYEILFSDADQTTFCKYSNLTSTCKTLFIRVFLRQSKFFAPETLISKDEEKSLPVFVVDSCLENLCHLGFLDKIAICRNLPDLLNVMDIEDLRQFSSQFCSTMRKTDTKRLKKHELIEAFVKDLSNQPSMDRNDNARKDHVIKKLHERLFSYKILNDSVKRVFKKAFHLYGLEFMSARNLAQNIRNLASDLVYVKSDENEEKLIRLQADSLHQECASLCYDSIKSKLKNLLNDETYMNHLCSLPVHLCKFSSFHVLARCLFKYGVDSMQKLKHYGRANECLIFLLYGSTLKDLNFASPQMPNEHILAVLSRYRGSYYERLAINLNDYMKNRARALNLIETALNDHTVSEDVRYTLFQKSKNIIKSVLTLSTKRQKKASQLDPTTSREEECAEYYEIIQKLEDMKTRFSSLQYPKIQYETVTIQRPILRKALGGSRKTIFLLGDAVDVPVEQIAIDYYKKEQNFNRALHDEGACWRCLFASLFFDYIYDRSVSDVWLSSQQTYPLDIHTAGALLNSQARKIEGKSLSDAILSLNCQSVQQIIDKLNETYEKYKDYDCLVDWDLFEDAKSLASCAGPQIISAICMYLAVDYHNRRSGFPDLVLWNTSDKRFKVVEVKGPGDRISSKQALWLSRFTSIGVAAELCNVIGRKDVPLMPGNDE